MAATATRLHHFFAHKKTVRLMVDDSMSLDALSIVKSLPDFQEKIAGVVPQFGGKCFDITMKTPEDAARLVSSGFDYEHEVKSLRLLGRNTIHVSLSQFSSEA